MTGAEHYAAAEQLLDMASDLDRDYDDAAEWIGREQYLIHKAGVHAQLALAAAVEKQTAYAHGTDAPGYGR